MWFLTHVWIIPALMALSFLLILFFGKQLPKKGAEIGIFFLGVVFVLALITAGQWISHSEHPRSTAPVRRPRSRRSPTSTRAARPSRPRPTRSRGRRSVDRAPTDEEVAAAASTVRLPRPAGTGESAAAATTERRGHASRRPRKAARRSTRPNRSSAASPGSRAPGRTSPSARSSTASPCSCWWSSRIISLLVHIFSTDYVHGDRRYTHYFAFLSLFTASMLFFVLPQSTLQMIVGWELVGVCSFVLIGHWWEEKPNSDAALKAFLTNRVGDVGLLVGVIILFFAAGSTFSILDVNILADRGRDLPRRSCCWRRAA